MEEALVKRVLPHSVEAEQSVIGSMLMDRDAIIAASEIVVADDFYQRQYGIMFDTMVELFNEGKPVDLVLNPRSQNAFATSYTLSDVPTIATSHPASIRPSAIP